MVRRRPGRVMAGVPGPRPMMYSSDVKFEVEVYRNDAGQWVAEAVEYGVSAKGVTEKEALARMVDALASHFKRAAK